LSTSEKLMQTGSQKTLYKWKVTANGGDVYLYKNSFFVGSSTYSASTTSFGIYSYTDSSYSLADTTFSSDGLLNYGSCSNGLNSASSTAAYTGAGTGSIYTTVASGNLVEIFIDKTGCNTATTTYKIPSGESRWLTLKSTIARVETTASLTENFSVYLLGDASYPTVLTTGHATINMSGAADIDTYTEDDLIWSPNSTSSSIGLGDLDFTNGYGITGLPTTNMPEEILTSAN